MEEYKTMRPVRGSEKSYEAPDELYVNGKTLTSLFDNGEYRHLTVTGRGLKEFNVSTTEHLNRSGVSINGIKSDPKELDIKYQIQARDSEDLRRITDTLQDALSGVLTIGFADDPDYVYEDVVLSYVQRNEENSYNFVGLFTLTAHNPFRIGKNIREEEVVDIRVPSVPLRRIRVDFNDNISNPVVELYDGYYWSDFTVNADVSDGDTLIINIDEDLGRITFSGTVPSNAINLGDLPQNFEVFNGARGRVKGRLAPTVTLTWRDVRL